MEIFDVSVQELAEKLAKFSHGCMDFVVDSWDQVQWVVFREVLERQKPIGGQRAAICEVGIYSSFLFGFEFPCFLNSRVKHNARKCYERRLKETSRESEEVEIENRKK